MYFRFKKFSLTIHYKISKRAENEMFNTKIFGYIGSNVRDPAIHMRIFILKYKNFNKLYGV